MRFDLLPGKKKVQRQPKIQKPMLNNFKMQKIKNNFEKHFVT